MRVALIGAHGKVARRLTRQLDARGDQVVGVVRNPDHTADIAADGAEPVVLDMEYATVDDVADQIRDADAVIFSAGAGPGSGIPRKDTVDRAAAVLLADAAERVGIRRYLLVSSMGVESVRNGATPAGTDEVFLAYLRAKLAAEEAVLAHDLDVTVLRPGGLTDDIGDGLVNLAPSVPRGRVPRDDVAAVLVELLNTPETAGVVLELVSGDVPIRDAVRLVTERR